MTSAFLNDFGFLVDMYEVTILGTASMVPTKDRHPQAIYLEFKGEGMLFDCGEGCQRQMNKAGISRAKVRRIFISHWHGDHTAGLIGLIKVHELTPTEEEAILETDEYVVTCVQADHGIPCLAYAFKEKDRTRVDMATCKKLGISEGPLVGKLSRGEAVEVDGKRVLPKDVTYTVPGKKIVIISDTQPCKEIEKISRHADVLICESTFGKEHDEKAQQFKHMTAERAAELASRAEAERLILTHFSQRYPNVQHLVEEAQVIFPNTEAAYDLMQIRL